MGMMDKFKNMFNMSEEEFLDDVDIDDEEPEKEDSRDVRSNFSFTEATVTTRLSIYVRPFPQRRPHLQRLTLFSKSLTDMRT